VPQPSHRSTTVLAVAEQVDHLEALRVLEACAQVAGSEEPVSALWEQRTCQLAEMRSNKVAIAVLGTALLAKATNPKIDALSLHERSGPDGYQARTLAREVLAANADRLGYALGTTAPDPLASSPWFGPVRIDRIEKWRRRARTHADNLINWLSALKPEEAHDALAAFLRVRTAEAQVRKEQRALAFSGEATVGFDELVATLKPFIELLPEEGRRGAAAVAAAFAAAGHEVVARIVNDPGQTDVDVLAPDGRVAIGIEVKQRPATEKDALDLAAGAQAIGATKALLCALDPTQPPLDARRLRTRADRDHAVALDIVYTVEQLLLLAIFSGPATRRELLSYFPAHMASYLHDLDVSPEAQERWKATAARWI
jgi:SacI restriction endonuclease